MTIVGPDAIGLLHQKYPVNKLIRFSDPNSVLGFLADTTFGERLDNAKKALASGKFPVILVDLLNNSS